MLLPLLMLLLLLVSDACTGQGAVGLTKWIGEPFMQALLAASLTLTLTIRLLVRRRWWYGGERAELGLNVRLVLLLAAAPTTGTTGTCVGPGPGRDGRQSTGRHGR